MTVPELAGRRRVASAAFVALLVLAIVWPSPVVSVNDLWIGADLAIDDLSFLGREAPSWDVVFWCIAGLVLFGILQSGESLDFREPLRQLRALRFRAIPWRRAAGAAAAGGAATAFAWTVLDERVLAWAERVQSPGLEQVTRLANRLGGGMNPTMIVVFFLVAGVAYAERRWVSYAVGMALAGLTAGAIVAVVKQLVGRGRPELWMGPSLYTPGSSTSFPSGHTVGAFALAGILVFGSRNRPFRVAAFALATAVAFSRILGFRHWASDVTASAALGLLTAWVVWRALSAGIARDRDEVGESGRGV